MTRTASSTLIAALALLVLLGVALAAGCTTTSSGSAGTPTPTPAGTTAVAAGTVATTVTSGSGSAAVAAVSYDRIIPFVPKTAGAWNLDGEAQGMTMKDGEGHDYTWVACDYVKPDNENAQANLAITDNGIATSPLKQQWQSFASLDTTEMSMKQVTVKGQPAWRVQEKKTNDHSMMILVGDRFMVWVQVTDGSEADLDAIVNAMDLAGLAALR